MLPISAENLTYELCRTFLDDLDGRLTVFRAFLDESGTHAGSPVITVAEYVARPTVWRRFVPKWQRTLRPIKVFHSTDCNGFRREWEGWTRPDRDAHVAKLLPLLRNIEGVGLVIGMVLRDVEEAFSTRPYLRPYLGNPYEACLQWWLTILLQEMQKRGTREPVAVVHEENQYGGEAHRAFNWVKENNDPYGQLISFSFGAKYKFVPLQAADILAYDVGKRLLNIDGRPRKSFEALMREETDPLIKFYDKQNLGPLISMLEIGKFLVESEVLAPAFVRRRP
jgi:hypothetical protein